MAGGLMVTGARPLVPLRRDTRALKAVVGRTAPRANQSILSARATRVLSQVSAPLALAPRLSLMAVCAWPRVHRLANTMTPAVRASPATLFVPRATGPILQTVSAAAQLASRHSWSAASANPNALKGILFRRSAVDISACHAILPVPHVLARHLLPVPAATPPQLFLISTNSCQGRVLAFIAARLANSWTSVVDVAPAM